MQIIGYSRHDKIICDLRASLRASQRLSSKESACNAGDTGDKGLQSGRTTGEGNDNPLQYLARKIPWTEKPRARVHGITKSWT